MSRLIDKLFELEGMILLLKYFLTAIGIISCMLIVWRDISAYQRKEYDPIIFRLRREYEKPSFNMFTNLGFILPAYYFMYIQSFIYAIVYSTSILLIFILTKTILNFKCYNKTKKKRIVIETVIFDLSLVFIVVFPMIFF